MFYLGFEELKGPRIVNSQWTGNLEQKRDSRTFPVIKRYASKMPTPDTQLYLNEAATLQSKGSSIIPMVYIF